MARHRKVLFIRWGRFSFDWSDQFLHLNDFVTCERRKSPTSPSVSHVRMTSAYFPTFAISWHYCIKISHWIFPKCKTCVGKHLLKLILSHHKNWFISFCVIISSLQKIVYLRRSRNSGGRIAFFWHSKFTLL